MLIYVSEPFQYGARPQVNKRKDWSSGTTTWSSLLSTWPTAAILFTTLTPHCLFPVTLTLISTKPFDLMTRCYLSISDSFAWFPPSSFFAISRPTDHICSRCVFWSFESDVLVWYNIISTPDFQAISLLWYKMLNHWDRGFWMPFSSCVHENICIFFIALKAKV